jgi:hypothetical protein
MNMSIKRRIDGGVSAALCSVLLLASSLALPLAGCCIPGVTPAGQTDPAEEGKPLILRREDPDINLPDEQELSWGRNDPLNLVVEGEEWISYQWDINGEPMAETGNSLTLRPKELPINPQLGRHNVTVKVEDKANQVWTKRITFTVVP